ncbi:MAG TPA: hypothetical protein PK819_00420 [Thermomicrobiales bacterium]|mgnify:CR=1 FL=1|nr:hypothetical protein [Thermomicrobiales bacterium]
MTEPLLIASPRWKAHHSGSAAAVVTYTGLVALPTTPALDQIKRQTEHDLIARFAESSRSQLLQDPVLAAYEHYDRQFGQSYHVAMQVRSIAQKGKPIPDRNSLIEAMFLTEVSLGVLAAAQDLDQISLPITIDHADGSETYTRYDGVIEACKPGDQLMKDATGAILTSIAQGPTNYGQVSQQTSSAAFCFYFVPGVPEEIRAETIAFLDRAILAACPAAEKLGEAHVLASDHT